MNYTPEERKQILERMHAASDSFYAMAAAAGCHAFIEFTGLMNEFIKVCEEADKQGLQWIHANIHGDYNLPFKPYHIAYLSEKLECIYGKRIELVDDHVAGWTSDGKLGDAVARILICSWREIFFKYEGLTSVEKMFIKPEEHAELVQWLMNTGRIFGDPKGGFTVTGETS